MTQKREQHFKSHILKSTDGQFYCTLVGNNGEIVFTGETKKRKYDVIALVIKWFPKNEIVDETRKKPLKK